MSCCNTIDSYFESKHANRDLERYLKHGPDSTTRLLIELVRDAGLDQPTLLDVGAGIGVLQHELLPRDISTATHLDASPAYLDVADSECTRREHGDRTTFVTGDITEVADTLDMSDVVLLDRVLCCYPNYKDLISQSISRCRCLYSIAYPRDYWLIQFLFMLDNIKRVFRRQSFRVFVHTTAEVEARIAEAGFERIALKKTWMWRVVAFRRL